MNFEKHSAEQLNQFASTVDLNRLWTNIDAELRPQKRPVAWMQWMLSGLALVALAALVFVLGKNENSKAVSTPITTDQAHVPNAPNAPNEPTSESAAVEVIPNSETVASVGKSSISIQQEPTQNTDSQILESKKIKSQQTETVKSALLFSEKKQNVQNTLPSVMNKKSTALSTTSFEPSSLSTIEPSLPRTTILPTKPINQLSIMLRDELPIGMDFSPGTGCYSFGKKNGWKPYLAVYGGAQLPLKTLKTDDVNAESLVDLRKETETVLEGVNGGVLLGLLHPSGFHIEAGGEYNRINERFEYTVTDVDTIGMTATTGFILNAPGDTTFFQDSVFVIETNESLKKIYNKYSFVQIPINLGYEFNTNARFTPYIKGGILINVRFTQKAEIMTTPSTSELYESSNADNQAPYPFRSSVGISPHIALGARLELNSWMHLFGEARYVHHLKPISSGDYAITQRYGLPGLNIGLRFFKPIRYD